MTAPDDKILDRVRALMAKAEATDYPEEAETYAAKAAELMARHGVEQAMLAGRDPASDPVESHTLPLEDPYLMTKASLLNEIASRMHCEMVYLAARPAKGSREATPAVGFLYGHRSDLDRVEFLYTSLLVQAFRLVQGVRPPAYSREGVRAYRRSWLLGFAGRIGARLEAATTSAVADSAPGAALVLVDRQAAARAASRAQHGRIQSKAVTHRSRSGYAEGHAAAERADLGHGRVAGRRRALS